MAMRGWLLYGLVGAVVMAVGFRGMFFGLQNGAIQLTGFEEDTPEGRSEVRWALWNLFASTVASGVLWPLSVPSTLRMLLRFLASGELPTIAISRPEDPFRNVDKDRMRALFVDLGEWRKSRPERFGDPHMVSVLMNGAAIEGRAAFHDRPEKDRRTALLAAFKSVLDGPEPPAPGA